MQINVQQNGELPVEQGSLVAEHPAQIVSMDAECETVMEMSKPKLHLLETCTVDSEGRWPLLRPHKL